MVAERKLKLWTIVHGFWPETEKVDPGQGIF